MHRSTRHVIVSFAVASFALASACSSGGALRPPEREAGVPSGDDGSIGPPQVTTSLTYYRDVKPILEEKCVMCHHDGGIAPFALDAFEKIGDHVGKMAEVIPAKVMPPWPPNDSCNHYYRDRSLSDAQIKTLTEWATGGAPAGNPGDYVPVTVPSLGLSRTDLELKIPVAYTPTKRPDDYRCFLVDWPETTTKYITGFGVSPGKVPIVHHAIAFYAAPSQVAAYQKLDDDEPGPGYTCFGGPGTNDAGWISGWAPGQLGTDFPVGTGIKMEPGSKIILQIHYNTLKTPPSADQTTMTMKLDDHVDKEAAVVRFLDPRWVSGKTMTIKAEDPDAMHSFTFDPTPYVSRFGSPVLVDGKAMTIWSAGLHMHTRGTHAKLSILPASGADTCLIDIPKWNFHWQGSYGLEKPITFNPGDQLKIECHWDNTAPNQPTDASGNPLPVTDLNWGEKTTDEMCLGFMYVTQ